MGQSGISASDLRNGKNEVGLANHSKIQTHKPEVARRKSEQKQVIARGAQQRVETHYAGTMGRTVSWEVRSTDLNMPNWVLRSGPDDAWKMARYIASIVDHDEARMIAFGGKKFTLELRIPGREAIEKFEVSGWPEWRYAANKVV